MKALAALLFVMAAIPLPVFAQDVEQKSPPPTSTKPRKPSDGGLRTGHLIRGSAYIGESAPDFELDASSGNPLRLSHHRKTWVLLVFGERKEDLAPLKEQAQGLREANISVIGVCDEKAYHLRSFARQGGVNFPLLADVTGEISALYGLYDPVRTTTNPGFFLIDTTGVVRMALLGQQIPGRDIASLARFGVTREYAEP